MVKKLTTLQTKSATDAYIRTIQRPGERHLSKAMRARKIRSDILPQPSIVMGSAKEIKNENFVKMQKTPFICVERSAFYFLTPSEALRVISRYKPLQQPIKEATSTIKQEVKDSFNSIPNNSIIQMSVVAANRLNPKHVKFASVTKIERCLAKTPRDTESCQSKLLVSDNLQTKSILKTTQLFVRRPNPYDPVIDPTDPNYRAKKSAAILEELRRKYTRVPMQDQVYKYNYTLNQNYVQQKYRKEKPKTIQSKPIEIWDVYKKYKSQPGIFTSALVKDDEQRKSRVMTSIEQFKIEVLKKRETGGDNASHNEKHTDASANESQRQDAQKSKYDENTEFEKGSSSKKRKLNEDSNTSSEAAATSAGPSTSNPATTTEDDKDKDQDDKDAKKKKNRCAECRKKVGLTGFECRCGGLYCAIHRYSDKHDCTFNYREHGAQEIRRNNPVVVGEKIQKI